MTQNIHSNSNTSILRILKRHNILSTKAKLFVDNTV